MPSQSRRGPGRKRKTSRQTSSSKASKSKKKKKKSAKRKNKSRLARSRRLRLLLGGFVLGILLAAIVAIWHLDRTITSAFEGRRWDIPAHVFAQPLELYVGRPLEADTLERVLLQLGYRKRQRATEPGTYARSRHAIELVRRPFRFWDGPAGPQAAFVRFANGKLSRLSDGGERNELAIMRLEPLLVGSLFPGLIEDRIIAAPEEIPDLLRQALLAVEDRRFEEHTGLDFRGIARALWVNLKTGEVRQGGSTLTQQLVKSYFLSNERTLRRKLIEAVMAVLLELRYDKADLLNAYINEVYLGQDGSRAIHGFAMASRFHFGRPLRELEPHQLALLVAMVRGPAYYDPRRRSERAKARRDRVLDALAAAGGITPEAGRDQQGRSLELADKPLRGASYFPAFMKLVRRQLQRDFERADLMQAGLQVFTTLDPLVQSAAERSLAERLDKLEQSVEPGLEGAVIVTSTDSAEILAAVGGRDAGYDGFNRVLDARRPVGSLLKPFIYLAAIESGRLHLASVVDDAPLSLPDDKGEVWAPKNYDGEFIGELTVLRALAESRNLPAVRVGLATGVERVLGVINRFGFERQHEPFPSVLLGAMALSPFEVAQVYNTLSTAGAYTPLNVVRFVQDEQGEPVNRYPLKLRQVGKAADLTQINAALLTAMRRGTGRSARVRLPDALAVAGKTGTTDELRDSWFAGFSSAHLAVVWIGRDDNQPAGLSGAAGALAVWTDIFADIQTRSLVLDIDDSLEIRWINYLSGLESAPDCSDTVALPLPAGTSLAPDADCGPEGRGNVGERALEWLRDKIG